MSTVFTSADELLAAAGRDLGTADWIEVDAARRDRFAAATHACGAPDGVPAFLVLALAAAALGEVFAVPGASFAVNYGLDDVRFGPPVPVGTRVRLGARVTDVAPKHGGAIDVALALVVERAGAAEHACTGRLLARFHFRQAAGGRQ